MKVRLVLLELGAIVFSFAVAQATTLPDESTSSSITCAPLATTPAAPGSNYEQSSSMKEMCTAADPWKDRMTGKDRFVGPVKTR